MKITNFHNFGGFFLSNLPVKVHILLSVQMTSHYVLTLLLSYLSEVTGCHLHPSLLSDVLKKQIRTEQCAMILYSGYYFGEDYYA